jgi:hypothetical protein
MKKILLTCAVIAITIFATEAQTKKGSSKKNKKSQVSTEARLNADIAKIKNEKRQAMEEQRIERLIIDSTRREEEKLEEQNKELERIAWKEQKLKEVDSTNQSHWKQQIEEKDLWYATERSQNAINKTAKLTDNQGRQIKAINMAYNDKSKLVRDDASLTEEQKKEALMNLNVERRAKIKTVIGTKKEVKLEKERKEYNINNKEDKNSEWMNENEVPKKSKKD